VYDKSPKDTYALDHVQVATSWIGIKESEHPSPRGAAISWKRAHIYKFQSNIQLVRNGCEHVAPND
jgi:hypothetical protein